MIKRKEKNKGSHHGTVRGRRRKGLSLVLSAAMMFQLLGGEAVVYGAGQEDGMDSAREHVHTEKCWEDVYGLCS